MQKHKFELNNENNIIQVLEDRWKIVAESTSIFIEKRFYSIVFEFS